MDNYRFCAQWILEQAPSPDARVLDYGCGAGQIVKELRSYNVEAVGCDVFYEGGDYSKYIEDGIIGNILFKMDGDTIPLGNESMDFVINNQVMEHVQNLDRVLAEIHRVLKSGGKVLSLFPDRSVWREGHCGIPFLHLFSKGSKARVYYAAALRTLGFGFHKKDKEAMHWSRDFCEYLDKWTYYRKLDEIHCAYTKRFMISEHIEELWLRKRLGSWDFIVSWFPLGLQRFMVRKLCGLVFVSVKPSV